MYYALDVLLPPWYLQNFKNRILVFDHYFSYFTHKSGSLIFPPFLLDQGITTYEYVVAMRAMSEAPAGASVDEDLPNILFSPTGSATTGLSGGSSLGLQYKGAWCTPPRVFVDYQVLGLTFCFHPYSYWLKENKLCYYIKYPKMLVGLWFDFVDL